MKPIRRLISARTACPSSRSKSQPLWKMPVPQHCGTGIFCLRCISPADAFHALCPPICSFLWRAVAPSRRLMAFRMAFLPYFSRMASTASCIRRSRARADCSSRRAVSALRRQTDRAERIPARPARPAPAAHGSRRHTSGAQAARGPRSGQTAPSAPAGALWRRRSAPGAFLTRARLSGRAARNGRL